MESEATSHFLLLGIAGILLILNGFFVAAEFALVKMRASRIDVLVEEGRRFSKTLAWHSNRLDAALAACQLGITLASLGLGWVGEPALAGLLEGPLTVLGLGSPVLIHTVSFIIAFTLFTALHITIGEQVPKIYAIRRPEPTALLCAYPLKLFYLLSYPFLVLLNAATNIMLSWLGLHSSGGHDEPHTEDEIRHLLTESRSAGELSKNEHRLMNSVFDFDNLVSRQIMIPRREVVMIDIESTVDQFMEVFNSSLHSRYPVYEGSNENVIGLIHVKDFAGKSASDISELRSSLRSILKVPETMSIPKLLSQFQKSKNQMALVEDEYGSIVGAVTMEDILERLVGAIQDEFDLEPEPILQNGEDSFDTLGATPIETINAKTGLQLIDTAVDSISGYVVDMLDRPPVVGDIILLGEGYTAEVLSIDGTTAEKLRIAKKKKV